MKKILGGGGGGGWGGGGYELLNIVGHYGWPTNKIFHFKSSKTARKT